MTAQDLISLVTAAATLVALGALVPAIRSASAAQKALDLSISERRRELENRARQLDVFWGYDRMRPGDPQPHMLMLINRGDATLSNIEVNGRTAFGVKQIRVSRLPPGAWRARLMATFEAPDTGYGYVKPAERDTYSLDEDPNYQVQSYTFTDAEDIEWEWAPGGGLRRVRTGEGR